MGIYLPNMEMPKYGCDNCFLRTGDYCGRIEKDEAVIEYARENGRHPDCPLVPVPPHGRLIDADALRKDMAEDYYTPRALGHIDHAPTIIPAEVGKDGLNG